MDKLARYQQILQQLVTRHAELKPSHGQIESFAVCDPMNQQYLLLDVGWDRTGRVHAVAFHARLHDGKIWIEWDGTEPSLTEELMAEDIPGEDIVLAFYRPEYRVLAQLAEG
ncbi:MAG: XisI protein [Chloroflexota bacterium]|nr:XisI protein [Chloroflexota bacterium]